MIIQVELGILSFLKYDINVLFHCNGFIRVPTFDILFNLMECPKLMRKMSILVKSFYYQIFAMQISEISQKSIV